MTKLLVMLLMVFISAVNIFAGDKSNRFDTFDQLLFEGKFEKLTSELIAYQKDKSLPLTTEEIKLIDSYTRVLEYEKYFSGQDQTALADFVEYKKSEEKYFITYFAGEKAAQSFSKFLRMMKFGKNLEAAKYYFIAQFFRDSQIEKNLYLSKAMLSHARDLVEEESYHEAIEYLSGNRVDAGNNTTLLSYRDSLSEVQNIASEKLFAIKTMDFLWKRNEKLEKKLFLSFGLQAVLQPTQSDFAFDVTEVDQNINVKSIQSKNNIGYSFELLYQVHDKFLFGGELGVSQFKYHNVYELNLMFFDFSYDVMTVHAKSLYFFKEFVGIRPYAGVGLGTFRASRGESKIKIITDITNNIVQEYTLPEKTITSVQGMAELGFQVVYNKNSNLFLNVKSAYYNNFDKDEEIVTRYNTIISAQIGFLF